MATSFLIQATHGAVRAGLERLGSIAPHPGGYRLDIPFRAEPVQIAHAERLLARRGHTADLRHATVSVRLVARRADEGWRLGFERVLRVGPVVVVMTEEQERLADQFVARIAERLDARSPVPA